ASRVSIVRRRSLSSVSKGLRCRGRTKGLLRRGSCPRSKGRAMKEMIERMMLAFGWMPKEREAIIERAMQRELDKRMKQIEKVSRERDEAQLSAIRAQSSWERAEERVRELESDYGMVNHSRARMLLLKDKLAAMSQRIDEVIGA